MAAIFLFRRSPADHEVLEVITITISLSGEVHVGVDYVEEEDIPLALLTQAHTSGVMQSTGSGNPTISQSGFSVLYVPPLPPVLRRSSASGHRSPSFGPGSRVVASASALELQAAEQGEGAGFAYQGPSLPGENVGPRRETRMPTHPYPQDISHRLRCCAHRDLSSCQCANAALLPDDLCPGCQNDACGQQNDAKGRGSKL